MNKLAQVSDATLQTFIFCRGNYRVTLHGMSGDWRFIISDRDQPVRHPAGCYRGCISYKTLRAAIAEASADMEYLEHYILHGS